MRRPPAVAGQFYPADPKRLTETITALTPAGARPTSARAVIVPHAGYVYSGGLAAAVFARVHVPKIAVIIGPNHTGMGEPLAVMTTGAWELPGGAVPIHEPLATALVAAGPPFSADGSAHAREHSLEVQVPFLCHHNPDCAIVPICAAMLEFADCLAAGKALAKAVRETDGDVLLVASTDMTHYESRAAASVKDAMALAAIEALDPKRLYDTVQANNITMCGVIPTVITMIAALDLGADTARQVGYTDSGAVSGDTRRVVAYAGYVLA